MKSILKPHRRTWASLLTAALLVGNASAADLLDGPEDGDDLVTDLDNSPQLLFYAALDGTTEGVSDVYRMRSMGTPDSGLRFEPGVRGKAVRCERHCVSYPADDVIDPKKGTVAFWFKWETNSTYQHAARWLGPAAMVNGNLDFPISGFNRGDNAWHHWAVTWNYGKKTVQLFRDGESVQKLPMREPFNAGLLRIGYGAPGLLDEVCTFGNELTPESIKAYLKRTRAGEAAWPTLSSLHPEKARYPLAIKTVGADRPALPQKIDWILKVETNNGARTRYSLDGLWRLQPFATRMRIPKPGEPPVPTVLHPDYNPDPRAWGYTLVPGGWRPFGNMRREGSAFDARADKEVDRWQDVNLSLYPCAWVERDFSLSELPEDASAFLVVEGTHDSSDFYVNDHYLGNEADWWETREFDITGLIKKGENNRLTVLSGTPYGTYQHTTWEGDLVWDPSGISCPIHLDVRPSRLLTVSEIFALPSYRKKQLGVEFLVRNIAGLSEGVTVACELQEQGTTGRAFRLDAVPCPLSGVATQRVTVTFDWKDPVLWFPDDPRLLNLSLTFKKNSQLLDRPFPVHFGFREVWCEKGDLWMNGTRFWLHGSGNGWEGSGGREGVLARLKLYKARGMNSAIGFFCDVTSQPDLETSLRAGDEFGFLSGFSISPPNEGTPEAKERNLRKLLRHFRNHPCVYGYNMGNNPYIIGPANDPISLGRPLEDADVTNETYKMNLDCVAQMKAVDPTRPVALYTRGVVGDYRSAMQYTGYGTPLQTREELFSYWAETRPAPFVGTEMDMWLFMYAWLWQKGFGTAEYAFKNGIPPLVAEHAARYWGNGAYTNETAELVRAIGEHTAKRVEYPIADTPNFKRLVALVIKHCCRTWRTYGVSFQMHCVAHPNHLSPVEDEALVANNSDFLAYIAGEAGNFVAKDHAFTSGENVSKQIILINGLYHPHAAQVDWKVVESETGRVIKTFSDKVELTGGDIRKLPFTFEAPAVTNKTRYRIELAAQMDAYRQADVFSLEVFPKAPPPVVGQAKFLLLDKGGDGARLLEKAGVPCRKIDPTSDWIPGLSPQDILVIGRRSLPEPEAQKRLLEAVERGLHVVCFEQVTTNVFGLKNDDPNTRHTFVSASDHPVVAGLSDEDFLNWRGASDILECYPDYRKGFPYGRLDHYNAKGFFGQCEFSQWSSKGTVAAFHFEKPQRGNVVPILSSGFDMLYSPLLELAMGQGRILVCALDVSNRYGTDPVATRVVNQLLQYAAQPPVASRSPMVVWGSPYWDEVLQKMGRPFQRIDTLTAATPGGTLWIGIGDCPARLKPMTTVEQAKSMAEENASMAAPSKTTAPEDDLLKEIKQETEVENQARLSETTTKRMQELAKNGRWLGTFVEQGGTLVLASVPSTDSLGWLPFRVTLEKKDVFLGKPEGVPELSGLTSSDFFFREVLKIPVLTGLPADGKMESGGFVGVVPCGKGKVIICQLYPDYFFDNWQKTKVLRILSTLLTHVGVPSGAVGINRDEAKLDELWYCMSPLDFNPDLHRSW